MSTEDQVIRILGEPSIDAARAHLRGLPQRYADCFSPEDIARHIRGLEELTPSDPVRLLARSVPEGLTEYTVLAYDHPAVFSLIAGTLSSSGLDIHAGDVFTTEGGSGSAQAVRAGRWRMSRERIAAKVRPIRRKIVDRFLGHATGPLGSSLGYTRLEESLRGVLLLLEGVDGIGAARARVNDMVADALAAGELDARRGLLPVRIEVDNEGEGTTILSVTSEDTPFFLYAFSSALSLHAVSIEVVRIRTVGSRIRDEFGVVDARGEKIREPALLDRIKLSALLTKQFCYFLASSPDPTAAIARFQELVENGFPAGDRDRWTQYLSEPRALQDLARLLGASDFLWEDFIRQQYEALLPIVAPGGSARVGPEPSTVGVRLAAAIAAADGWDAKVDALNRFKDAEIYAYDLDHILDPSGGHTVLSDRLTRLAECVVREAVTLTRVRLSERHGVPRTVAGLEVPYVVAGLGKLGGAALGYASDIELLVVYQDAGSTDGANPVENGVWFGALARELASVIRAKREGIFSVDLRLRPYGATGQTACSLDTFCRYYARDGDAHAYERLALVGLRSLAGDSEFGARLERVRDELLYVSGSVSLQDLRALRARQAEEKDAIRRSNAKFSPGALVDLEYTVQILQVMHGQANPALRTPRTRDALAALRDARVLEPAEAERLAGAYAFLRRLINALRMLRGSALDLYLPDPTGEEYVHLARRMGYPAGRDPGRQLRLDFETQTAEIRTFMTRHFGEHSLLTGGVGSMADLIISRDVPVDLRRSILARAGFRDTDRAYRNLTGLLAEGGSRGVAARLAVLSADMLPRKPDADMALNNWERYMERVPDRAAVFERLLSQPTALDILLSILASSQYLSDTLVRHPEFFDWLVEPVAAGRIRRREEIERDLDEFCGQVTGQGAEKLRVFRWRELARIGTKDIALGASLEEVVLEISELADAVIQHVLDRVLREQTGSPAMAVIALGKLGGRELNYSSDIDLVGVYAGDSGDAPAAARVMEALRRQLGGHAETGSLYRVDFRLRPYGTSGELAVSERVLLGYYESSASLWELQAAMKARVVAGDAGLRRDLVTRVRDTVRGRVAALLSQHEGRGLLKEGLAKVRATALRPRGRGAGQDDIKNGPGGIREVEFFVQGMLLEACPDRPELWEANTLEALRKARDAGLLDAQAESELGDAYRFLRKVEHYLQIFDDRQTHRLPTEEWRRGHLARCLMGPTADSAVFLRRIEETRHTVARHAAR